MSFRPAEAPEPEPTGVSAREKLRQARVRLANALFNRNTQTPNPKTTTPVPKWESDKELNAFFDTIDAGMFEEDTDVYYKYDDEELNDQYERLLSLDRMIKTLLKAGCVDEDVHRRWLVEIEQARAALDGMAQNGARQHVACARGPGTTTGSIPGGGLVARKGNVRIPRRDFWPVGLAVGNKLAAGRGKAFDEIVRELGRQNTSMPTGEAALRFVGNMVTIGYIETINTYTAYARMNEVQLARQTISDRALYIGLVATLVPFAYGMITNDYYAFEEEVATLANDYGMFGLTLG